MIPMFNKAAELCVPYFNALLGNVIPHNTLVISIAFALLAPLGLFRGPLTLFGCGAATLGILKGIGFSTPYLFALMVIPSITMNVSICMTQSWIAWGVSYAKVSTREHLKRHCRLHGLFVSSCRPSLTLCLVKEEFQMSDRKYVWVSMSAEHIQKPLPSTMRPMKLSESLL